MAALAHNVKKMVLKLSRAVGPPWSGVARRRQGLGCSALPSRCGRGFPGPTPVLLPAKLSGQVPQACSNVYPTSRLATSSTGPILTRLS